MCYDNEPYSSAFAGNVKVLFILYIHEGQWALPSTL
jgi:hypothetical protein